MHEVELKQKNEMRFMEIDFRTINKTFFFSLFAACLCTMAERTLKLTVPSSESPDAAKCIKCQKSSLERTSSTENGHKRIREVASIRNDSVSKRLKLIGDENFFII